VTPRWYPVAIFVFALLWRLIGINWGLPNDLHAQSYHPDEPVNVLYAQQVDLSKGDFEPGFYNYPTLYLTALRIVSDMTSAYTGAPDPKSEASQWAFFGRATKGGRILAALAGAGTALVVFFLLRRLTTDFGAILGAALVAIAPAFSVHSRFATVDVPSTFFFALTLLYAVKLLQNRGAEEPNERQNEKLILLGAVFAGLAAGTKYNAGLGLLSLIVAIWLVETRVRAALATLVSILASGTVFLITTPGILTNSAKFWKDFNYELGHSATGHGLVFLGTNSGFIYHLQNLFLGVGILLTLLGGAALLGAAYKKHLWAWVVLASVLPYYLMVGRAEVKFMRYTFPLVVGLGVGFGWLMGRARQKEGKWHYLVGAGLLGLGGVDPGGFRASAAYAYWMANEDPRDQAGRYLKENASAVAIPTDPWFYTAALYPDVTLPRMAGFPKIFAAMQASEKPLVVRSTAADLAQRFNWDASVLTDLAPQYVSFSSLEFNNVARLDKLANVPEEAKGEVENWRKYKAALEKDYQVERVFGLGTGGVEDLEYIQPVVQIWKRK